jgi:hypothetical protein
MKKIAVTLLITAMAFYSSAQTDTSMAKKKAVEIELGADKVAFEVANSESLNMQSLVAEVTFAMAQLQAQNDAAVARINKMEATGALSPQEAETLKAQLAERRQKSLQSLEAVVEAAGTTYSDATERWLTENKKSLEDWGAAVAAAEKANEEIPALPAVPQIQKPKKKKGVRKKIVINEEGMTVEEDSTEAEGESVTIEMKEKDQDEEGFSFDIDSKTSKKIKRTDGYFDIAFGFNQQLEEGQFLIQDAPGEHELGSWSFMLGKGWKTRLGSPYSKFYLKYGIEFSWHNFRLTDNYILDVNSERPLYRQIDTVNFDKNKYHIAYFNVPLMLQLDFSGVGERDENFTLGLGGYAGFRLNDKRELEYRSQRFESIEEKAKGEFYTNPFRYGAMAQLGYGSFKVTATYDLNPFFRNGKEPNAAGFAYNMVNVMVGFSF